MLKTILQPNNAEEALNTSQHMINNVDIPLGFVRTSEDNNTATNELTQWVVFKDLKHKKLYYRTYHDTTLRMIDLNQINFAAKTPMLKMPITSTQNVIDMTSTLRTQ